MQLDKENMRMSVPKQIAFGLAVVIVVGGFIIWLMLSDETSDQTAQNVSAACAAAFANAASVSDVQDTHENLFPAYSACMSIEEWKAANELHPDAIDGVEPVGYARTVCANNRDQIGNTPICQAAAP